MEALVKRPCVLGLLKVILRLLVYGLLEHYCLVLASNVTQCSHQYNNKCMHILHRSTLIDEKCEVRSERENAKSMDTTTDDTGDTVY